MIPSPSPVVRAAACAAVLAIAALAPPPAAAEVEKNAIAGGDGIEMFWWPRLPALAGWDQDHVASMQYGANVLVPAGKTFGDAAAAIYAIAQFRPRLREIRTLAELMDRDRRNNADQIGSIRIKDSPRILSGDRHVAACMVIEPVTAGLWERNCYLEEGEYFLVFSLRAQNRANFFQAMPAFEALIAAYRE